MIIVCWCTKNKISNIDAVTRLLLTHPIYIQAKILSIRSERELCILRVLPILLMTFSSIVSIPSSLVRFA